MYLRGDFNISNKNIKRTDILKFFCSEHNLSQVSILHETYHHFMGNGASDSHLDKILFSTSLASHETLETVHCKLNDPLIDSHHDIIITKWKLPNVTPPQPCKENIIAPKIENTRKRVLWDDSGIERYQDLVTPHLSRLQSLWLDTPTKTSVSLLLESTNNILTSCASLSNKTESLSSSSKPISSKVPLHIRMSKNKLLRLNRRLKQLAALSSPDNSETFRILTTEYNQARCSHRKLTREVKAKGSSDRDWLLFTDPAAVQRKIKSSKRNKAVKIQKLTVGDKTYVGDSVQDGFFDSISQLKTKDEVTLNNSEHFQEFSSDYHHILELCKLSNTILAITESQSFKILQKMKPNVNDFFGITPNHYNYAGPAG